MGADVSSVSPSLRTLSIRFIIPIRLIRDRLPGVAMERFNWLTLDIGPLSRERNKRNQ